MDTQEHNGWTNYATWRVALEIFDGMDAAEYFDMTQHGYELGQQLKYYAIEIIESNCNSSGLARDYALAFMDDVNWREIAEHMIDDARPLVLSSNKFIEFPMKITP